MRRMKSGELQFLVATDIAARGIDISDLSHVVNYALPEFTEVYLHRVGRTGRIGKKGTAVSLVAGRDQMTFTQLERDFGIEFEMKTLPEFGQIIDMQAERVALDLQKAARDTEVTSFLRLAERMLKMEPAVEGLAFLLKQHFSILEAERSRDPLERGIEGGDAEEVRSDAEEPRDSRDDRKKRKKKDKDRDRDRGRDRDRDRDRRSDARTLRDGVRLFVNRGSNDGYDEAQVKALVADAAGSAQGIGSIQLRRTHSFVEVTPATLEAAVAAADEGLEREDKPVNIEPAHTRG